MTKSHWRNKLKPSLRNPFPITKETMWKLGGSYTGEMIWPFVLPLTIGANIGHDLAHGTYRLGKGTYRLGKGIYGRRKINPGNNNNKRLLLNQNKNRNINNNNNKRPLLNQNKNRNKPNKPNKPNINNNNNKRPLPNQNIRI